MTLPLKQRIKSRYIFCNLKECKLLDNNAYYKVLIDKDKFYFNSKIIMPKIGVIISKKIYKRANKRNRCKRRLLEAYKYIYKDFYNELAVYNYMVFFAKRPLYDCSFADLLTSLRSSLAKLPLHE